MVKYKLVLEHDSTEMMLCIALDVEMPALPRIGESILVGNDKESDYVTVDQIYHYPLTGEIEVQCECPDVWLMLASWRSVEGWTISEGDWGKNGDKFRYYLSHPEEEIKEP